MEAQEQQVALPLRSHTILGVCEAIGEDFGFNPIFLRVPLGATVVFSPTMAIAGYFALGLIVLVSRLLFPKPKKVMTAEVTAIEAPAPVVRAEPQEFAKPA